MTDNVVQVQGQVMFLPVSVILVRLWGVGGRLLSGQLLSRYSPGMGEGGRWIP